MSETPSPEQPDRLVRASDLVGAAEIAQRMGLAQSQTVHSWRRRHADFPEPVATLKRAMVWDWQDVVAWAQKNDRL